MMRINLVIDAFFKRQNHIPSWHYRLMSSWRDIAGSLASTMQLGKIEGSTLYIGVYDARWMQELTMLSSTLIASVNNFLENTYITDVKFMPLRSKTYPKELYKSCLTQEMPKVPALKSPVRQQKTFSSKHDYALSLINDHALRGYLHELFYR